MFMWFLTPHDMLLYMEADKMQCTAKNYFVDLGLH